MNSESKVCQNCKTEFAIEPEDFEFYKTLNVPPPTFCWLCRAQRRLIFRNERALFKRTSDLSGKEIFSTYPSDAPFPVYEQHEWYSDAWDPLEYGRDYDFSRPFFEQYAELSKKVPRPSKSATGFPVNSDYSNNITDVKNCYLIFNAGHDEDCAYGNAITYSKDCFDNTNVNHSEFAYENFNSARCNRSFFSVRTVDCTDVYFSKDLRGCSNCFGCTNLRKKNYHIFNKPYSKEDYAKEVAKFDLGSYRNLQDLKARAQEFWLKFPNKFREDGVTSVDVSGDYIYGSKNAHYIYQGINAEDVKYCQYVNYPPFRNCYDFSVYGENTEHCYECAMVGDKIHNLRFCLQTFTGARDLEYCEYAFGASNCFGSISLNKKQYCILNRQYTKEQYEELVPKIRKHMDEMPYVDGAGHVYRYGEFFPDEFSPFGYNETVAQEHFSLTKEQAIAQGYKWQDVELKNHTVTKSCDALPDHVRDVDESILKETIGCAHQAACDQGCSGAFRIIASELQFYKRFNIALPRLCVNCRHRERLMNRNTLKLWHGHCMCDYKVYENFAKHDHHPEGPCPNEFETSYSPDRKEIIYCGPCYQLETT